MADEPLEGLSKLWDKVSDTVIQGLKTGKEELLRTSKMGKIRLEISSVKNRIEGKQRELGSEVYKLWLAKKAGIAELEGMFAEIKLLEDQIKEKEKEIEKLVEEKEPTPLAEVKPLRPAPQAEKPQPKPKVVKKAPPKKSSAKKPASKPTPKTRTKSHKVETKSEENHEEIKG